MTRQKFLKNLTKKTYLSALRYAKQKTGEGMSTSVWVDIRDPKFFFYYLHGSSHFRDNCMIEIATWRWDLGEKEPACTWKAEHWEEWKSSLIERTETILFPE